jgi:hypothetical protein
MELDIHIIISMYIKSTIVVCRFRSTEIRLRHHINVSVTACTKGQVIDFCYMYLFEILY